MTTPRSSLCTPTSTPSSTPLALAALDTHTLTHPATTTSSSSSSSSIVDSIVRLSAEGENTELLLSVNALPASAVIAALLATEQHYVSGLQVALERFELPLKIHQQLNRTILTENEINEMAFPKLVNIYNCNKGLAEELNKLLHTYALEPEPPASPASQHVQQLMDGVAKTMRQYIPFFKLYSEYNKNCKEIGKLVSAKRKQHPNFDFFVTLTERCTNRRLVNLLQSPVNRLAQYLIFIGALYQKCEHDTETGQQLFVALRSVQEVIDSISNFLRDQSRREKVVNLQTNLFGNTVELISSTRYLIKYGKVKLASTAMMGGIKWTSARMILCNDLILLGTRGKLTGTKVTAVLQLNGLGIEQLNGNELKELKIKENDPYATTCIRIVPRDSKHHKAIVLALSTPIDKQNWLAVLHDSVSAFESVIVSARERGLMNTEAVTLAGMEAVDFENMILKKKYNKRSSVSNIVAPKCPIVTTKLADSELQYDRNTNTNTDTDTGTSNVEISATAAGTGTGAGAGAGAGIESDTVNDLAPPPLPPYFEPLPKWTKLFDENYQTYYYQNNETNTTQWEVPDDYAELEADNATNTIATCTSIAGTGSNSPTSNEVHVHTTLGSTNGVVTSSDVAREVDVDPTAAIPVAPPDAPVFGVSAPVAPPILSSCTLTNGSLPPPISPLTPTTTVVPSARSDPQSDLLASIRSGAVLRKTTPVPAPAAAPAASNSTPPVVSVSGSGSIGIVDLNAALKNTLDRYRQFVQNDDDDDDKTEDWDED